MLADTHASNLAYLAEKVIVALSTVGLTIHAGDFTDTQLKEAKGVQGNMDSREVKTALPTKEIARIETSKSA